MSDLASILEDLRGRYGRLTPQIVLDEARDPGHPLHNRFEWDDSQAAEKYRLTQAYELIRVVRRPFQTADGEDRQVRRYYATRAADAEEYEYDEIEEVMRDSFRRRLLFNEMQRRIDELVQQYGALQEFWAMLRKKRRPKAS